MSTLAAQSINATKAVSSACADGSGLATTFANGRSIHVLRRPSRLKQMCASNARSSKTMS